MRSCKSRRDKSSRVEWEVESWGVGAAAGCIHSCVQEDEETVVGEKWRRRKMMPTTTMCQNGRKGYRPTRNSCPSLSRWSPLRWPVPSALGTSLPRRLWMFNAEHERLYRTSGTRKRPSLRLDPTLPFKLLTSWEVPNPLRLFLCKNTQSSNWKLIWNSFKIYLSDHLLMSLLCQKFHLSLFVLLLFLFSNLWIVFSRVLSCSSLLLKILLPEIFSRK